MTALTEAETGTSTISEAVGRAHRPRQGAARHDRRIAAPAAATRPTVVVAANRLPIRVGPDGRFTPSDGGLVRALLPVAAERGVRWVGSWPDGLPAPPAAGCTATELDGVRLDADLEDAFYAGCANRTLWPMLHGILDHVEHHPSWWSAYVEVNRRFADRLQRCAPTGSVVWVHDYHLFLVPAMLRRWRPDLRIGFFLHTPFPAADALDAVPETRGVLRGVLGADVVGFQTGRDADRFLDAATTRCGAHRVPGGVRWRDRGVEVVTAPASIDAEAFRAVSRRRAVRETASAFRALLGGRRIVLGVDRLDYTKAIPERVAAYEELLRCGVVDPAAVAFVQLAIPTRSTIPAYAAEHEALLAAAERLNACFSRSDGASDEALLLHLGSVDLEQLVAMYVAADVMVVSPRADGMNLVAKEYCAAHGDGRGVLVLSRGAGAAEALTDAVSSEDHRPASVACAVRRALALSPAEQTQRMSRLHDHVAANDATRWATTLLDPLCRR